MWALALAFSRCVAHQRLMVYSLGWAEVARQARDVVWKHRRQLSQLLVLLYEAARHDLYLYS